MDRAKSVVTPARFQSGMTFAQYLAYVGTPENLKREGTGVAPHIVIVQNWTAELAPQVR